jgi:hypothetical protein
MSLEYTAHRCNLGRVKSAALLLSLACAAACGNSSSPAAPSTPPTPTTAVYAMAASPNPIVASPDPFGFQYMATFTATVTETAGVSGNIDTLIVTLHESQTNLDRFTIGFNPSDIQNRAGTNHIGAKGTLDVPISLHYNLTGSGRQATLIVGIILVDDFGHRINLPNVTLNVV